MSQTTPEHPEYFECRAHCWQQLSVILSSDQVSTLLSKLAYPVLLDSGSDPHRGHFDILSGQPDIVARFDKQDDHLCQSRNTASLVHKQQCIPPEFQSLPFVCGEIAYCSYEYGARQIIGNTQSLEHSSLPLYFRAYYSWSYIYNRESRQGLLTFSPACSLKTRQLVLTLIRSPAPCLPVIENKAIRWQKNQRYQRYLEQFEQIKNYIVAGDCYQVNLAQRFEADFTGTALQLFFTLRQQLNTPYSTFFSFAKDQNLLCFSPEQFLGIQDRRVVTRPIKGTIENTGDPGNADRLASSAKNQAENLMIVDLLRNDLSKVCQTNSVSVTKMFALESYRNVHHLVSTIEGVLEPGISELEAFFACFPGGSITGAPKKRAMEIINELEESGRDAYCGSVYYLNDNGNFDSNILIRSIVHSANKLYCWGGGGIVHDSVAEEEYQESLTKVANLTGIFK